MKNVLIGAISGNYSVNDIKKWVESSDSFNLSRLLLLYNDENKDLKDYILSKNIDLIIPKYDAYNNEILKFETNTGMMNINSSYHIVHNIRFYHIWQYLLENALNFDKVLITDVRDVYFNDDPFLKIPDDQIIVSSEVIRYDQEEWNERHLFNNLTMIGIETLHKNPVYNVGVFGGNPELVKSLCKDIYLLSVGKPLVADQTSFNYLIQTSYKNFVLFTDLDNKFAVHLHVVANGKVKFDMKNIPYYSIIHQHDRIK